MITITSLWIAALVLLLLFLARSVRTVHRAIRCPLRGSEVRVSFLEAEPEGRPIEVIACSEFRPEAAIICDRRCRALVGRRRSARPESGNGLVTRAPKECTDPVAGRLVPVVALRGRCPRGFGPRISTSASCHSC